MHRGPERPAWRQGPPGQACRELCLGSVSRECRFIIDVMSKCLPVTSHQSWSCLLLSYAVISVCFVHQLAYDFPSGNIAERLRNPAHTHTQPQNQYAVFKKTHTHKCCWKYKYDKEINCSKSTCTAVEALGRMNFEETDLFLLNLSAHHLPRSHT